MNDRDTLLQEIINTKVRLKNLSIEHWLKYELLTWQWWFGLANTIIPLIVWWKLVDRKRILEISVYGLIINVSAVFLDVIGSEYVLWVYPIRILPQVPLLFPVDFILLPVILMFVYQWYPKWKSFLVANAIAAAILSFVVEPLTAMIGQYKLIKWSYFYSFPIYLVIIVFSRLVTRKILSQKRE